MPRKWTQRHRSVANGEPQAETNNHAEPTEAGSARLSAPQVALEPKCRLAFSGLAFRANAYREHTHLICRLPLDYLVLLARAF